MNTDSKKTQRSNILRLLLEAHGEWIALPEITARAAQYGARIYELRKMGFRIVNKTERIAGQTRSWFRLENWNQQLPLIELPEKCPGGENYPD